jgi:structural maintenance of chromosome 1
VCKGEVESEEQSPVSEPLSAPEELKKIHVELEIQKARAEEKMIPTHQKRKMFAAQRKLAREQEETEDVHRIRTELVTAYLTPHIAPFSLPQP